MNELILALAFLQEPRQFRAAPPPPPRLAAVALVQAAKPEPRLSPAERAELDAAIDRFVRERRPMPDFRPGGAR